MHADSVVEMADDQFVTLVLQNNGVEKECLEEGTRLGVVTTTTVVSSDESDSSRSAELSRLQSIAIDDPPQGEAEKQQERVAKLFSQLGADFSQLVKEDRETLKTLLSSYSDVFALDPSELGTTDLVTHSIYTDQHLPIKQPLRRTHQELIKSLLLPYTLLHHQAYDHYRLACSNKNQTPKSLECWSNDKKQNSPQF